jgi:hypothetical protein
MKRNRKEENLKHGEEKEKISIKPERNKKKKEENGK